MNVKQSILAALEQNRGTALSGQALAQQLGVSRNAVWKAIHILQAEGYAVLATPNRGYRLADDCDRLSAAGLAAEMRMPVPVYAFDTLDSTNSEARRRVAAGEPAPFVVVAEGQTEGRGRRGRSFFSPQGAGLYITVALSAGLAVEEALGVTAYAAVCVTDALLRLTGRDARIKWVNDLYWENRKVCGILTEAVTDLEGGTVDTLLVGIGLNLRPAEPPAAWREVIGNLRCEAPLKNTLGAAIADALLLYPPADTAYLTRYRERSLTLHRRVRCTIGGQTLTGTAETIDARGALCVRTDDGQLIALRGGEVELLPVTEHAET